MLSLSKCAVDEQEFYEDAEDSEFLGVHYSIDDAEYQPPWALIKAIRKEFDPRLVPVLVREAWRTPDGEKTTVRWMLARECPDPSSDIEPLPVLIPAYRIEGMRFKGPLVEGRILETEDRGYFPIDGRVYRYCQAVWQQNHNKRTKDIAREVGELQQAPRLKHVADVKAGRRDELRDKWKYLERLRENETDYDRSKHVAAVQEANKPRPMVYVRHSAA